MERQRQYGCRYGKNRRRWCQRLKSLRNEMEGGKWLRSEARTSIGKDQRRSPGHSKSDSSTPWHVSTLHRKKWGMMDGGHFCPASLLDLLMSSIVVKQITGHALHGKWGLGLHGVLGGLEVDEHWVAVYTAELAYGLALLADHLQWS